MVLGRQSPYIHEHASKLLNEVELLQQLEPTRTIPLSQIMPLLESTKSIVQKIQRQPLPGALQADVRSMASIIKNMESKVTLLHTAASKNLPLGSYTTTTKAWAKNTESLPNPLAPGPIYCPSTEQFWDREVTIQVPDTQTAESICAILAKQLKEKIESAIHTHHGYTASDISGVSQLKSGDVRISAKDEQTAKKLQQNTKWMEMFGAGAKAVQKSFGIIVDDVKIQETDGLEWEQLCRRLEVENKRNIPGIKIKHGCWLCARLAGPQK
jgi:hypothetical protein